MIATLLSGRLTFALGVAIGARRPRRARPRRPLAAVPLAAATSFASPVAGFFLLLIGATLALDRRPPPAAPPSAAPAAIPIAAMALVFPTPGPEPFVLSSLARHARRRPARLRRAAAPGARCCAAAPASTRSPSPASSLVPNAMGGNVVRLSNLAAGPVLALGLAGPRRRLLLAVLALPLLYWQWQGAVRDVSRAQRATPRSQRELLHAAARRAGGAAPGGRRCGSRSRRPRTAGRSTTWPQVPRSPAAGSASSNPTDRHLFQRDPLAGLLPRLAAGQRRHATWPCPSVPLDYLSHREAPLIRQRPALPEADLAQPRLAPLRGARRAAA